MSRDNYKTRDYKYPPESDQLPRTEIDLDERDHLAQGTRIHRYLILEFIEMGGMGAVYKAYDPELDRRIAIKILKFSLQAEPKTDDKASLPQTRLMREAQALARLNHPNVVSVFDVGTYEDGVYIAMEYIEGLTLRDWLKEKHPNQKEILEVFLAAGCGLQAAHAQGVIHRDFKPENLLIGKAGQVKVLDFGLARAADFESLPTDRIEQQTQIESDSGRHLFNLPLTQAGDLIGTTAYMAPEHFVSKKLDEKTDQFSFCVTLFEALYGSLPFFGKTQAEFEKNVTNGNINIPNKVSVSGWIQNILVKGLSVLKTERFENISAVLEALGHDPDEKRRQQKAVRKRRFLIASLVLLVMIVPMGVYYGLRYRVFQHCRDADTELDQVWNQATKANIQKAFMATDKAFVFGVWERVSHTLDRYLVEWKQMRNEVCEATWLLGTQSEERFDLRMNCLKTRSTELRALVEVFTTADTEVTKRAVQASLSLTRISGCADEKALLSPYPLPKTQKTKAKVDYIRQKLAEVEAFSRTGKYREGLDLAQKLQQKLKTVDYVPVKAQVLYWLGILFDHIGHYKQAEIHLVDSARLAGDSKDTLLVAKTMTQLVWVVGHRQARHEDGLLFGQFAEVAVGLGGKESTLNARLQFNLGLLFKSIGKLTKALDYYRNSHEIRKNVLGPQHPEVAMTLNGIGMLLYSQGQNQKALEYYHQALEIVENSLGTEHPNSAAVRNNIGQALRLEGEVDKAFVHLQKSLEIDQKSLGPNHPDLTFALQQIGIIYREKGNYKKALEYFLRVLSIRQTALGPTHRLVAQVLHSIGLVFLKQGKHNQALDYFQKALKINKNLFGFDHQYVANTINEMGTAYFMKGENQEALEYYRQALRAWEKVWGKDYHALANALMGMGKVWIKQGLYQKAHDSLSRVVSLCQRKKCETAAYGHGLFGLAQVLVTMGGDKMRAVELAHEASIVFRKNPKKYAKELKALDIWLKTTSKARRQ